VSEEGDERGKSVRKRGDSVIIPVNWAFTSSEGKAAGEPRKKEERKGNNSEAGAVSAWTP